MIKTKPIKRKAKAGKPNYIIIGKGGNILVVSGATGQISTLDKARSEEVLELVRQRQKIGRQLAAILSDKGFVLTDEVVIDIEG
jgi:hypothetical protein